MTTEIEICGMALNLVGKDPIVSFTDADRVQSAKLCKVFYPASRDAMLREHPWGFARKQVYLTQNENETIHGFDYAYYYPSDCIMARSIYAGLDPANHYPFGVQVSADGNSRLIVTSVEDAVLEYTKAITNPNMFDPLFIEALAWRISIQLAFPLTGKAKGVESQQKGYSNALAAAKVFDANEGHMDMGTNRFIRARR